MPDPTALINAHTKGAATALAGHLRARQRAVARQARFDRLGLPRATSVSA